MVWYTHFVKSDFFRIFKKTVWSPDAIKSGYYLSTKSNTNVLPVQPIDI